MTAESSAPSGRTAAAGVRPYGGGRDDTFRPRAASGPGCCCPATRRSSPTCGPTGSCVTGGCTRSASLPTATALGTRWSLRSTGCGCGRRSTYGPSTASHTTRCPPSTCARSRLSGRRWGPARPSGWAFVKTGGRGPGRGVIHAVDCEEALAAHRSSPWSGRWTQPSSLGTGCARCAAAELDPVINGLGPDAGSA